MSRREKVEEVLGKARVLEEKYQWAKAAELYKKTLLAAGKRDLRKGEIQERVSYCLYKGAFQAETQEQFKSHMFEAVKAYEKAAEKYQKTNNAKSLYCKTMILYANSWTVIDVSRKKEILHNCERLLKKAMKAFEEAGDLPGCGKACNDLSRCLWDIIALEWNWTENERRLQDAIKYGQNAISILSKIGDKRELARAYIITGLHSTVAGLGGLGEEKRKKFTQIASDYAERALELSKKIGDASLISGSNSLALETQSSAIGDLELSLGYGKEALRQAKKTKDCFMIGVAFLGLAFATICMVDAQENPDRKRETYEKAIEYAENALRHCIVVCRYDYLPEIYAWYVESHYSSALEEETDLERKRNLLERAIKIGRKGLEYTKKSGIPTAAMVHHALSKALYTLSQIKTPITEKRTLLEEASEHTEKSISLAEQAWSLFDYLDHVLFQSYAALTKAKLATIKTAKEEKTKLMEEAISHMERCINLCTNL
jgi:tetratricopeptide (TPR) repeat protein